MMPGSRRQAYLDALGIQRWRLRAAPAAADESKAMIAEASVGDGTALAQQWQALAAEVAACQRCELAQSRTQTVFGVGNKEADWLVIGEAPGADEDRQGEPFVGRAGQLLTQMLLALGYRREHVYIANILKCRPPNNRDPLPEEVRQCENYLKRQIGLIQPKIILAVGRIAAQNLLKTDAKIGALRGRVFGYGEQKIPVVVTYHPAYLLRSPREKAKTWQDLLLARRTYQELRFPAA